MTTVLLSLIYSTEPSEKAKKKLIPCLSLLCLPEKKPADAMFLSIIDYGDLLYMNALSESPLMLDAVYHGSLQISDTSLITVHFTPK